MSGLKNSINSADLEMLLNMDIICNFVHFLPIPICILDSIMVSATTVLKNNLIMFV